MAEAVGGAVQRRAEKAVGAVEVEDGVASGDVEGRGRVELEAVGGEILRDAGVGEEGSGGDHEALGDRGNGGDRVCIVDGVEYECGGGIAADFVVGISAAGGGAERVGDGGGAAGRTGTEGECAW